MSTAQQKRRDGEEERAFRTAEMERLSALESGFKGLRSDVTDIKTAFNNFSQDTRRAINALSDKLSASQKTQWPVILTSAGLALTIAAMLASGYVRDLSKVEMRVELLDKSAREEIYARGVADQWKQGHTHEFREALSNVRSEMRILDDGLSKDIQSIKDDLGSRKGNRWNKSDHLAYRTELDRQRQDDRQELFRLRDAVRSIAAEQARRTKSVADVASLADAMERIAKLEERARLGEGPTFRGLNSP